MGARRHRQEGALTPCENVVKYFYALVVTAKLPVDELFYYYYYFHNLSSASGDFAPEPPSEIHPWTPLGNCLPQTPNLPTPGKKNPVGAHAFMRMYYSPWNYSSW